MNKDKPIPVPDSLVEILIVRAKYEQGKQAEIKVAYDAKDKDRVFDLVGEMLYEGPGSLPRQKPLAPDSKSRRKQTKKL